MDIHTHEIRNITITPEILKLIAEVDEFKGRWKVMESLAPEKLTTLRRIATIESVGSSTRIEGAKLSDREVDVFRRLGQGRSTRQIADDLGVNLKTVQTYCGRIKEKLGLEDGQELARLAYRWHESHDHRL